MPLVLPAAGLSPRPVTRFAPSPTGPLHLGHVANMIWTWGVARALGGTVLLRLEDHDRGRCRPEYEEAILDDLEWLGFAPDNGPLSSFRTHPHPFRQSDAEEEYIHRLAWLDREGLVYGCRCSRKTIADSVGVPEPGDESRYPGTCRSLGLSSAAPQGARVRMPSGPVECGDLHLGTRSDTPADQCGDLLVRDGRGQWTYQFSVVVDDWRQNVDLVVRGEDLLPSTGRQILLGRLLGRPAPPAWVHHPLIRGASGAKLSKRDGATGLRELRDVGRSAPEIIGLAAHGTGLVGQPFPMHAEEVGDLFRFD